MKFKVWEKVRWGSSIKIYWTITAVYSSPDWERSYNTSFESYISEENLFKITPEEEKEFFIS